MKKALALLLSVLLFGGLLAGCEAQDDYVDAEPYDEESYFEDSDIYYDESEEYYEDSDEYYDESYDESEEYVEDSDEYYDGGEEYDQTEEYDDGGEAAEESSKPAVVIPQVEEGSRSLTIFLPSDKESLGDYLAEMAAEEGIQLTVDTANPGASYTERLAEVLAKGDGPDIYWLEDESAARELAADEITPANLGETDRSPNLRALAEMTPAGLRLLSEDKGEVYGLPLGMYGEGVLVNMDTLAPLMGSVDPQALLEDLINCNAAQWQSLVDAVASYLVQPKQIRVRLNNTDYNMPSYRPETAKALRGVFAYPAYDAAVPTRILLSSALATQYDSTLEYMTTAGQDMSNTMVDPLNGMRKVLDYTTRNMTGEDGAISRGASDSEEYITTEAAAKESFAEGTSLMLYGDTKLGLQMEAEHPALQGSLALVPVKLPLENAGDATYKNLALRSEGYLCLSDEARASAEILLVRLFSDAGGLQAIETMHLLPFTNFYPNSSLLAQQAAALSTGAFYRPPVSHNTLASSANSLSSWMENRLIPTADWGAEQENAFRTAALAALALPDESTGEVGAGSESGGNGLEMPASSSAASDGTSSSSSAA